MADVTTTRRTLTASPARFDYRSKPPRGLRDEILLAKREADAELEAVAYETRPAADAELAAKVWRRPAGVRGRRCCTAGSRGPEGKPHKPKSSRGQKLSRLAAGQPTRHAVAPLMFHLLRRFFASQSAANELETHVFDGLRRLSKKELEALRGGLEVFSAMPEVDRHALTVPRLGGWTLEQPMSARLLQWHLMDEGVRRVHRRGLDEVIAPGRVRPWSKPPVATGDAFLDQTAPWPWINEVEGLRCADHRQAILGPYLPAEYQQTVSWTIDPQSGQPAASPEMVHAPSCTIAGNTDQAGNCLRVAEARVGAVVTLTGFNFFAFESRVRLTRTDGAVVADVEAVVIADTQTPVTDATGHVIADHHVRDTVIVTIPDTTPDGLYEFPPGDYRVEVIVPNTISFATQDGTVPAEFVSNTAFLTVLPRGANAYRIWSDLAHCYDPTDGEAGSDELHFQAFRARFDATSGATQVEPAGKLSWSGVSDGDTTGSYLWNLLGNPGAPEPIQGMVALGVVGWEVDSEDALDEGIKAFGDAFTKFWNLVWIGVAAGGAGALVVSVVMAILAKAVWWIALVVVAAALIVLTVVGLIWAAWAPPDLIALDVIALSEAQAYFLTLPTGALPPASSHAVVPELPVAVLPDGKVAYLYTEERRYRSDDEGSLFGLRVKYQRDK